MAQETENSHLKFKEIYISEAVAWARSQIRSFVICGGQSGVVAGFLC
jgi:hypothetical protein